MLYILNTLMTPLDFDSYPTATVKFQKISVEEAKKLVSKGFTSAIGHESTAKVLSQILSVDIPANRIAIRVKSGDSCLHFYLKERLPEGKILSEDELKKLDYWLVLSQVQ